MSEAGMSSNYSDVEDVNLSSRQDAERLLPHEQGSDFNTHTKNHRSSKYQIACRIGLVAWTLLTVALLFLNTTVPATETCAAAAPKAHTLHCGNTTEEARALGCQFDTLSALWIPAECADFDTDSHFRDATLWTGYTDRIGSESLSIQEMSEILPPRIYWTSIREHIVHCAYMWRRQHRGYLEGGGKLDHHARDYSHTVHCSNVLLKYAGLEYDIDTIETMTEVSFSNCVVYK